MRKTKITGMGFYIMRNETVYDTVIELAVSSYDLDRKTRKEKFVDNRYYLIKWWTKNKRSFSKYKTITSIAELLKLHHTTIIHHQKRRTPSLNYNENVECIKDFLNS